jgi:hypothetical protein
MLPTGSAVSVAFASLQGLAPRQYTEGAPYRAVGTKGSGIYLRGSTVGPGLQIINNEFSSGSIFHEPATPDSDGDPEALTIEGVRIAHNSMGKALGSQAELSLTQTGAHEWKYDFCDMLVFPQIASIKYHVVAAEGYPVCFLGDDLCFFMKVLSDEWLSRSIVTRAHAPRQVAVARPPQGCNVLIETQTAVTGLPPHQGPPGRRQVPCMQAASSSARGRLQERSRSRSTAPRRAPGSSNFRGAHHSVGRSGVATRTQILLFFKCCIHCTSTQNGHLGPTRFRSAKRRRRDPLLRMYREMKTKTFVKTPDPPGASRLRYRRKQNIQIPVFVRFVYTDNFICGGTGNKSFEKYLRPRGTGKKSDKSANYYCAHGREESNFTQNSLFSRSNKPTTAVKRKFHGDSKNRLKNFHTILIRRA